MVRPPSIFAHDIPNDVTVQTFLKPSGQHMELLMRVPLKAMRDVVFPEKGPGYLDLEKADPMLPGAATLWLSDFIDLYESDLHGGEAKLSKPQVIATRISLESDKSFADFDAARAHVTGPKLAPETNVAWNQTYLDVLFQYPIRSDRSLFSIHARLQDLGLRVITTLRFIQPNGTIRAFEFEGNPGLMRLDPRWYQAAARFVFRVTDVVDPPLDPIASKQLTTSLQSSYSDEAVGAYVTRLETDLGVTFNQQALNQVIGGAPANTGNTSDF